MLWSTTPETIGARGPLGCAALRTKFAEAGVASSTLVYTMHFVLSGSEGAVDGVGNLLVSYAMSL